MKGLFPSLKGHAVVQSEQPLSVLRITLNGGHAASMPGNPNSLAMPSFGWKLWDGQIASVATYVSTAWATTRAQ
ncbi:hypothetical protein [Mesorhizobium sp. ES1-3]|uniref:c-type cytochrome n=1 Tax=Mesorhizobium sp. ES1-3 TaxID=2876628 RepID=UPI001CCAC9ED|nr:hypothetical protein [Mesorhizobium sp. ES1-3]